VLLEGFFFSFFFFPHDKKDSKVRVIAPRRGFFCAFFDRVVMPIRVAASMASLTPRFVKEEHSIYFKAPISLDTSNPLS